MSGLETPSPVIDSVERFARSIGTVPIRVRRESMGFIYNRIGHAIRKEALDIVDSGIAEFEDVDRAWMLVRTTSIGPFGLMDLVGLDTALNIERVYAETEGRGDSESQTLRQRVDRGDLGVKSGRGFYTYPSPAYSRPGWLHGEIEDCPE